MHGQEHRADFGHSEANVLPRADYAYMQLFAVAVFFEIMRGRTGFDGDRCDLDCMSEMLVGSVKNEQT